MPLIWRTNFTNPYGSHYTPAAYAGQTYIEALQHDRDLFNRFIKGRPQATSTMYTTEELEAMGMIGLYENVSAEEQSNG